MSKQKRTKNTAQRIPTTEKLAKALEQANAPTKMIERARAGYYDDYKSELAFPIIQLVQDATRHELYTVAEQAKAGKFDGQKWEADEWAKSPEGRATFQEFMGKMPTHD